MKSLLTALIFLIANLMSYGDEFTLKEGITVEAAKNALDRFKYSHGNQHQLQWAPSEDEEFVFCKLSDNQVLVLVFSTKSDLIKRLLVVADQKQRKDYPILVPSEVRISNNSFHLVFARNAEQGGAGQPATRSTSKSEDGDKPQTESEGRSR